MKPGWKEMLIFSNTAFIAGLIYYTKQSDSNGAVICTLVTFIVGLLLYFFFHSFWRNKSGKR
jgi:hypothetical protein